MLCCVSKHRRDQKSMLQPVLSQRPIRRTATYTRSSCSTVLTTPAEELTHQHSLDEIMLDGNAQQQQDFKIKVVLLGESACGKTSLVNRYISNTFTQIFLMSVGMDCKAKYFSFNTSDGRECQCTTHIWDTAGQRVFHKISLDFLHEAQAVMLVYDVTERSSFIALHDWVRKISQRAEGISGILVGNKSDEPSDLHEVSASEGQAFADQHDFFFVQTSAQSGENVEKAFKLVMGEAISRIVDPQRAVLISNLTENVSGINSNSMNLIAPAVPSRRQSAPSVLQFVMKDRSNSSVCSSLYRRSSFNQILAINIQDEYVQQRHPRKKQYDILEGLSIAAEETYERYQEESEEEVRSVLAALGAHSTPLTGEKRLGVHAHSFAKEDELRLETSPVSPTAETDATASLSASPASPASPVSPVSQATQGAHDTGSPTVYYRELSIQSRVEPAAAGTRHHGQSDSPISTNYDISPRIQLSCRKTQAKITSPDDPRHHNKNFCRSPSIITTMIEKIVSSVQ